MINNRYGRLINNYVNNNNNDNNDKTKKTKAKENEPKYSWNNTDQKLKEEKDTYPGKNVPKIPYPKKDFSQSGLEYKKNWNEFIDSSKIANIYKKCRDIINSDTKRDKKLNFRKLYNDSNKCLIFILQILGKFTFNVDFISSMSGLNSQYYLHNPGLFILTDPSTLCKEYEKRIDTHFFRKNGQPKSPYKIDKKEYDAFHMDTHPNAKDQLLKEQKKTIVSNFKDVINKPITIEDKDKDGDFLERVEFVKKINAFLLDEEITTNRPATVAQTERSKRNAQRNAKTSRQMVKGNRFNQQESP